MDQTLNEDIGRLYGKHGRNKVQNFFRKIQVENNQIPPTANTKRAMYNFTRASYPKDVVISPSYLRSDVILGSDSSYSFTVLKSDQQAGAVLPRTSKLLDQNDTFEMTALCFLLWTKGNVAPLKPAQQSRLYTYPNPSVFAGAGESSALDGVYFGGRLLIEVGTDKVFPSVDLLRFYRVPTSQQGVAASVGSVIPYDGWSSEDYPWMDSIPGLTISGNGKYTFQVSIPEAASLAPPAGQNRDNYLALYIRGLLCSNGAKQMNKKFSVTY